jgi:hypothetical protein
LVREATVHSWEELLGALHEGSWRPRLGRHRLTCAYRGAREGDDLRTGLMRLGGPFWRVEAAMLRAFRKYARHQVDPRLVSDSLWSWMAVAQHHGLPTRLLDWTHSPFVAMHFATATAQGGDAQIWRVDYRRLNTLLPRKLQRALIAEEADVFSAELLAELAPRLEDLQRGDFALFFEPPSLDGRIVNQFALFSLMSDPSASLDAFLRRHPEAVRRIVIPASVAAQARDFLDQSNVTERLLFPGLDGLTRYLKRYYTPATSTPAGESARGSADGSRTARAPRRR